MREVRLNAGKQQGSAPRAVDLPVRSPATFTRCDLSLSKTPNGAILPQNHSESGECRPNTLMPKPDAVAVNFFVSIEVSLLRH